MKLKIVSFNIRNHDDENGHSINERAPRLKAVLDSIKPDVMGLQESVTAWEEHLNKDYLGTYDIYLVHRSQNESESCPILWRKDKFNCIDKGHFWLSDTPDVESRGWDELYHCYRICLWVILEDKSSSKRILYLNTHFGFGDKGQCDSAALIANKAKEISELPTVLTGDFNLTPDSTGYSALTNYFTDVNAATVQLDTATYHAYGSEDELPRRIDYCFVNDKAVPLYYKVLDNTFDGKYPSDHYGILTELEV